MLRNHPWVLAGLGAAFVVACAGPTLPDAPNPPHVVNVGTLTPTSPGPSGQTPAPVASLPPPPHGQGSHLVATSGGYLEFTPNLQNQGMVFFLFPYDSQLSPLQASTSGSSATLTLDGTPVKMTAAINNQDGSLFFYGFPGVAGGTHQIQASVTIAGGSTYQGSFPYP